MYGKMPYGYGPRKAEPEAEGVGAVNQLGAATSDQKAAQAQQ